MANGANRTRISQKSLPANARRIPIPAAALGPWLAEIENPDELKVTLRVVAILAEGTSRGGVPPSVSLEDLLDDPFLERAHSADSTRSGLASALERGTLMAVGDRGGVCVFLNDEACRRYFDRETLECLSAADVLGGPPESVPIQWLPQTQSVAQRANIFALYEEHIGPYGHSVAEQLKAAESEYPPQWIEDAFAAAIERNAASWNYIHAILRRWLQEGRYAEFGVPNSPQRDQHHEHGKPGRDTAPDSRTGYLESYRRRHGRLPWESGEPTAG